MLAVVLGIKQFTPPDGTRRKVYMDGVPPILSDNSVAIPKRTGRAATEADWREALKGKVLSGREIRAALDISESSYKAGLQRYGEKGLLVACGTGPSPVRGGVRINLYTWAGE